MSPESLDESAGSGDTRFTVNASALSLPVVQTLDRVDFRLSNGATVTAGSDFGTITDSTWVLSGASSFSEAGTTSTYDPRGLWADSGGPAVFTFNWTLLQASGAGTSLDLSSVESPSRPDWENCT